MLAEVVASALKPPSTSNVDLIRTSPDQSQYPAFVPTHFVADTISIRKS